MMLSEPGGVIAASRLRIHRVSESSGPWRG